MTMKVLLAGETWISHKIDVKGFSSYSTGAFGEGQTELVEALEAYGHEVTHIANHVAVEQFPWSAGELSAYDVVMLSDISADTLQIHPDCFDRGQRTPDRLRLIADFVDNGGGLLMVGGYMSFSGLEGKARYQATPLASVLPVEMLGYDDRVETPEGVHPVKVADHELLGGVEGDWPHFLGYNLLRNGSSGTVLLEVDSAPMLVVGEHGRGRTAAFASDCSPHWGSPEFLEWAHYGRFWGQLVGWLGAA
ncbi:MAG: glutamine amidotransferase [Solirubrobacteraceae bacterium]